MIPAANLAFVHCVNTFNEWDEVMSIQTLVMLDLILNAMIAESKENPTLVPLEDRPMREDRNKSSVFKR